MATVIIGAAGSMGARYRAILTYLEEEWIGLDIEESEELILSTAKSSDRIILCTPTETHFQYLEKILPFGKPTLCEKPITKSLDELKTILDVADFHGTHFTMMFQYSELLNKFFGSGESYYNYFRTGKDGLVWDCLQIIGLAKGDIELRNDSPIWDCVINGQTLSLSLMDSAYVSFVKKWLNSEINQDPAEIFRIHAKTERMNNEQREF